MPLTTTPVRARSATAAVLTVVQTEAALALLSGRIGLDLASFVLAALLPVLLSRLPRHRSPREWLSDTAVVAATAMVAVELPSLLQAHAGLGSAALIACAVGSKALRGHGRPLAIAAVGAGLAVRLALIALVAPGDMGPAPRALTALLIVLGATLGLAGWRRVLLPRLAAPSGAARPATRAAGHHGGSLQMLLAFSLACALGRWWVGAHWNWAALSAFLVLSGTLTRADVLKKGLHRLVGAAVGTVAATVLVGWFGHGSRATLPALIVAVVVAIALRRVAYAGWVGGITAALSLLYSYMGQNAVELLDTRLWALSLGALLAIATAMVVPVRPPAAPPPR